MAVLLRDSLALLSVIKDIIMDRVLSEKDAFGAKSD